MINQFQFLSILNELAHDTDRLDDLSPGEFEGFVSLLLSTFGYDIEPDFRTLRPIDSVVRPDIIARVTDPLGTSAGVIECKKTKRAVGVESVEQADHIRQSIGAHWAMVVTTSHFSDSALRYARGHEPLRLIDRAALHELALRARLVTEDRASGFLYRLQNLKLHQLGHIEIIGGDNVVQSAGGLHLPREFLSALVQVEQIPLRAIEIVMRDPRHLTSLSPRQFEEFIAEIVDKLGFCDILLTPRSGDGGKDVIATRTINGIPLTFYFECKKYAEGNKVQLDTLRALLGTVAHDSRKANIGVLVTTSTFTRGCQDLIASECRLDGKDYNGLLRWIADANETAPDSRGLTSG
jgi:restriction endonuclease Mrr